MRLERGFTFHLSEPFPRLPTPPVAEAAIQWVARASRPLEADELQRHLAERLPDYPERHPQHQIELEAKSDAEGPATQTRRPPGALWRSIPARARRAAP